MQDSIFFLDQYSKRTWIIKGFIIIIGEIVIGSIAGLFYFKKDFVQYRSFILACLYYSLLIYLIYRYVSPYIVKISNYKLTIFSMLFFISMITLFSWGIYEYGIIEYPTMLHREMFPSVAIFSFFMLLSILVYFSARTFHILINTINYNNYHYQIKINGFINEINELRLQANPKLLSQSLANINRLLTKNQPNLASEYCSEISNFMHHQLKNSMKESISLEEEMHWLIVYIDISKILYPGINLSIHTENDDLLLQKVPPNILQTVMESYLLHFQLNEPQKHIHIYLKELVNNPFGVQVIVESEETIISDDMQKNAMELKKKIAVYNQVGKWNIQLENQSKDKKNYCLTIEYDEK